MATKPSHMVIPVHIHLQEEDRADDKAQDAYIQALHLWILLTAYAIFLDEFKDRKTQECLRKIG